LNQYIPLDFLLPGLRNIILDYAEMTNIESFDQYFYRCKSYSSTFESSIITMSIKGDEFLISSHDPSFIHDDKLGAFFYSYSLDLNQVKNAISNSLINSLSTGWRICGKE